MIVYAITNRLNGKRYIGMTEMTLAERWKAHRKAADRGSATAIHGAIRKYGADQFDVSVIAMAAEGADRAALAELERLIIAQESVLYPFGYNMTSGGDGIPKGHKFGPGRKNGPQSAETKEKRAATLRGRKHPLSDEARAAHLVRMRDPGFRAKVSAGRKGQTIRGTPWTAEVRARLMAYWTPERRAAMSKKMREVRAARRG